MVEQIIFYKIGSDREIKRGRTSYDGPKNAVIVIGIPTNNNGCPIRVVYGRWGGTTTHADLEGIASPRGSRYLPVKAQLSSQAGENEVRRHILSIYVLPEKAIKDMERLGHTYPDPFELLPERTLSLLRTALGATECGFITDTREEQAERQQHMVRGLDSGFAHLRWEQAHYTGG
ncbi:hypothetical protein HYT74_03735 [Candidatus Daviesbacteria bacterium]|nr:hypothetical protein [Candidatus Daviesbacteria bacterium]